MMAITVYVVLQSAPADPLPWSIAEASLFAPNLEGVLA